MKEINPDIAILIAQAENTLRLLRQNHALYSQFKEKEFAMLGKTTISAMVLSQVFVDFYTCIETFFFRVSQEFENRLRKDQWHKELLEKMALQIPDIRPNLISGDTYNHLSEILLFRHFRRYYFDYSYDWDKLELIESRYQKVFPLLINDIKAFTVFLKKFRDHTV